MTENTGFEFDINPDTDEKYIINDLNRTKFDSSPLGQSQFQQNIKDEQIGELAETEFKNVEDGQPGFIDYLAGFGKHLGVGVAKGFEETGETFGILEDDAWNLPEPENIAESLGQGIGQFLPMFGVGGYVFKGGLKLANLFQKSGRLTNAGRNLTAIGAGAFSDVVAFDPKDPNMGNLALGIGAISESPTASAFVKKYLAQDDDDPEAVARLKNALTGVVAGAFTEALIRGTGYLYRTAKGTSKPKSSIKSEAEPVKEEPTTEPAEVEPSTVKEEIEPYEYTIQEEHGDAPITEAQLKEASKEIAEDITEVIETARTSSGALKEGVIEAVDSLPNKSQAIVNEIEQTQHNFYDVWEQLKNDDPEVSDQILEAFHKLGEGAELDTQTFMVTKTIKGQKKQVPLINSMNFLKLNTDAESRNTLQYLGDLLDIKRLTKPKVPTEDLNTVIEDLVSDFHPEGSKSFEEAVDLVGKAASNVDDAIRYVGSAKILAKIAKDQWLEASRIHAKQGTKTSKRALKQAAKNTNLILRAGGLLSKKSSDLLRSFGKSVDPRNSETTLKTELLDQLDNTPKKLTKKIDQGHQVLENQDKITRKVHFEELKQTRKTTVKKSETATGRKATQNINKIKKTVRTLQERIRDKVARLKRQAASEKRPERGQPFPKDKPIPDTPEIKYWKGQIKKIKQERDTLENKFKRGAKEQLKYRKQFNDLSEDIENLRKGLIPQKKGKPLAPTEIAELKATKKKELQKLKEKIDANTKTEKRIETLKRKYNKALLNRINKDQNIASLPKREITELEKELQAAITQEENIIKNKVTRQELEATLIEKSSREVQEEINNMSLRQLKTRVASLEKGMFTKTGDTFLEFYINGLLSSFKTIGIVNPVGNTSAFVSTVIERAFAGVRGDEVAMRESIELAWNFISGMPDAFRTFLSSIKNGPKDLDIKTDFINPRERAISKEFFNLGGSLGKAVDYMGTFVNMPGKILLAQDEAFKGLVMRGETRALAYRKARNKYRSQNLSSPEIKDKIQKDFDDILNNLSDHTDVTEGAKETARRNTFTNELPDKIIVDGRTGKEKVVPGLTKSVQNTLDRHGFLKVFVPFFRTPANILYFTWERTPVLQFLNKKLRDELTSSDLAVKHIAQARVGTSMAITTAMFGMAFQGNFTGAPPRDRKLRASMERAMGGSHWYSFNYGGGWKKYDRFDPYGMLMASSATMATMAKNMIDIKGRINKEGDPTGALEEKYNEVINSSVLGTLELIKDRHYIQGISEFISFLSGDARGLTPTFKRLATAADPRISFYSSFRRGITRGIDTDKPRRLQRGVGTTGEQNIFDKIIDEISLAHEEALRDVTPGYGKVSPEKDLAGNVVSYPGTDGEFDTIHNLYNTSLTPSPSLVPSKSPLIQKIAELELDIEQPSSIKKMGNVVLNEEEKDYIIDTWTSLNKKLAEPLINTTMFKNSPVGLQKLMLETVIKKAKQAAKQSALGQFERLKEGYVDNKINDAQRQVNPQSVQGFQPPELFNAR